MASRATSSLGVMVRFAMAAVVLTSAANLSYGQGPVVQYDDLPYDALPRPTDMLGATPYDLVAHHPPDLLSIRIGRWNPPQPATDLFTGAFAGAGGFARIDLTFAGVVNPPGNIEPVGFDPFRYGPHPAYGFIEIDIDDEKETGGETDAPQYRYLANVARFGGLPDGSVFDDRLAERASDIDNSFMTDPYVERHGEEYHWALLGGQFADIDISVVTGDADLVFEAGEDWRIVGDWFHRAHGFEPYSLVYGGGVPGGYSAYSVARFAHDSLLDETTVSLVIPLTNTAASNARGLPDEPFDSDAANLTSIGEGLNDLEESAEFVRQFPSGDPEEMLITGWYEQDWYDFLDPADWRLTALLGATYTAPGAYFIWTDTFPNPVRGDCDGNGTANAADRADIGSFISDHDAMDGMMDNAVALSAFAEDFDLYDVSYDGVVDAFDMLLVSPPGDMDDNGAVDLADVAAWQRCAGTTVSGMPCALADIDGDGDADERDLSWVAGALSGPQP